MFMYLLGVGLVLNAIAVHGLASRPERISKVAAYDYKAVDIRSSTAGNARCPDS